MSKKKRGLTRGQQKFLDDFTEYLCNMILLSLLKQRMEDVAK